MFYTQQTCRDNEVIGLGKTKDTRSVRSLPESLLNSKKSREVVSSRDFRKFETAGIKIKCYKADKE